MANASFLDHCGPYAARFVTAWGLAFRWDMMPIELLFQCEVETLSREKVCALLFISRKKTPPEILGKVAELNKYLAVHEGEEFDEYISLPHEIESLEREVCDPFGHSSDHLTHIDTLLSETQYSFSERVMLQYIKYFLEVELLRCKAIIP